MHISFIKLLSAARLQSFLPQGRHKGFTPKQRSPSSFCFSIKQFDMAIAIIFLQ